MPIILHDTCKRHLKTRHVCVSFFVQSLANTLYKYTASHMWHCVTSNRLISYLVLIYIVLVSCSATCHICDIAKIMHKETYEAGELFPWHFPYSESVYITYVYILCIQYHETETEIARVVKWQLPVQLWQHFRRSDFYPFLCTSLISYCL